MTNRTTLDALAALLDRQAIWDCMMRYTRGVDRLDEELIRSAYWEDAHDSHGRWNGPLDEFLAGWLPGQAAREAGQHFVSNQSISFEGGDREAADVETYFMSSAKMVGSDQLEIVAGRYVDRFEKRAGEWRIKTRLVVLDWECTSDASGMVDRLARAHRGSRDRRDPSYERPVRPRHGLPAPTH